MIRATSADRPAIEAFLHGHVAVAMFPLSNLAQHGMAGGHPRAMTFWLRRADGVITDVLAVSEEGMIFPVCPTGPWGDVATVMAGARAKGVIGEAGQVAACRAALGLEQAAPLDAVEPQFVLDLGALVMPEQGAMTLHHLRDAPLEVLLDWRAAFCVETMGYAPRDATERAIVDIHAYLDQDTHRVLMQREEPLAMTGFNAILPQIVQVGGVYTPPGLRGRGHARLAVALHLAEMRALGVKQAVLSAANAAAARAYAAIGFRPMGEFAIVAYGAPQVIRG